jgi:hypothetical protein
VKRLSLVIVVLLAAAPLVAQNAKPSLARLIESGDRKTALEQIRAGTDVNQAQPDGSRPIQWAIHRIDYELIEALLAKKANPNVKNEFGSTPIAQAAELGDARIVKMLLDAGAEPEGANPDGQTALMLALKTGETAVVDLLLKAAADVGRHGASQRGGSRKDASGKGRRLQAAGALHGLANPDYGGTARPIPSGWRTDRVPVRGAQRMLRLCRRLDRSRRQREPADTRGRDGPHARARQRP